LAAVQLLNSAKGTILEGGIPGERNEGNTMRFAGVLVFISAAAIATGPA